MYVNPMLDHEMYARQIKALNTTVDWLKTENDQCHVINDQKDGIICGLHADVDDRNNHIRELGAMLQSQRRIDEIRGNVTDRDRYIEELKDTISLERIDYSSEMSVVKRTLRTTIKALRTDVDDRDRHIEELNGEVNRLRKIIKVDEEDNKDLMDAYCALRDQLERIQKCVDQARGEPLQLILYLAMADEIKQIIDEDDDLCVQDADGNMVDSKVAGLMVDLAHCEEQRRQVNNWYCDAQAKLFWIKRVIIEEKAAVKSIYDELAKDGSRIVLIPNPLIDEINKIIQEE